MSKYFIRTTFNSGQSQIQPYSEKNVQSKIRRNKHYKDVSKIEKMELKGSEEEIENYHAIEVLWVAPLNPAVSQHISEVTKQKNQLESKLLDVQDEKQAAEDKNAQLLAQIAELQKQLQAKSKAEGDNDGSKKTPEAKPAANPPADSDKGGAKEVKKPVPGAPPADKKQ